MKPLFPLRPVVIAAIFSLGAPLARGGSVVNSTGDGGLVYGGKYGCESDLLRGGVCTLRAAIEYANLNPDTDTITFNIPGSAPYTINLGSALTDLSTDMNITGPGAKVVTVQGGGASIRIFNVTTTGSVSISGLTIALGGSGGVRNGNGGTMNLSNCTVRNNDADGVFNFAGIMFINNCTVSDNVALGGSGAGINNAGRMTVTGSTVRRNLATFGGGGIVSTGILTMTKCTVADNRLVADPDDPTIIDVHGGGILSIGTLTLSNCNISGNSTRGRDGQKDDPRAGEAGGGGIAIADETTPATLTMTNCTVFGNSAEGGNNFYRYPGGAAFGGGVFVSIDVAGSVINVSTSTIYGNSAVSGYSVAVSPSQGGGIYGSGTVLKSTLIARNSATTSGPDVFGSFVSRGFNLIERKDGSTGFTAATDLKGTINSPLDPKLGPLQNNGGATQTMALLPGSPAIDKGTSVTLAGTTLTTDQRGTGFPRKFDNPSIVNATGGDGTDIGAFERQAP